jgi:hypothetical protein
MKTIVCSALLALSVTAAGAAEADPISANAVMPGCRQFIDPQLKGSGGASLM